MGFGCKKLEIRNRKQLGIKKLREVKGGARESN